MVLLPFLLWATCLANASAYVLSAARHSLCNVRARSSTISAITSSQVCVAQNTDLLFGEFRNMFQGHFDNVAQVQQDRDNGLSPREGGGHEHIHCHIEPLAHLDGLKEDQAAVLASYYFDGQPERLFRTRIYLLQACEADPDFGDCVEMAIFRVREEKEQQLKENCDSSASISWDAEDTAPDLRIPECSIFWRKIDGRFDGRMRTESIVVQSPVLKKAIVVQDDVALSEDSLWCNDRGHDTDGNYVYGNIHGIPYKMDRVQWARCPTIPTAPGQPGQSANPYRQRVEA
eukprot:6205402-Pleurochrysis_carterae.AAC.3